LSKYGSRTRAGRPLVDLGMKHASNPTGFGQWLSYVLVASGWIFVTTVAAAAARVLQRG
jgi:hypothetical protein